MGEIVLDYYTNLFTSSNPTVFYEILARSSAAKSHLQYESEAYNGVSL